MISDAIQPMMPPAEMIGMFTHVIASDRPIASIAQDVPAACEKNKLSLLTTYAYHDILAEKGFPIERKAFVYEICQARTASLMLSGHPEFAVFMPCKIALYEDGGKTILSTMNMDLVLPAAQDDPALFEEATRLFGTLRAMMESLGNG
jgi:uncharacterized protein (DUF302 family)